VKNILALVFVCVMSGCSTKQDSGGSNLQIVRNATSSLSIALAYLQLGNTEKAEPNLQKALNESPQSGAVYLGYALYYQQIGDYEKAEAAFFQARQYSPRSLIPQDFVTYLCRKGEYESATSHYSSVVSVAGERVNKSLLIGLAECYYQQEYWAEAEEAYLVSLEQPSGTNDRALLRLAELSLNRNEPKTALEYLTRFNMAKTQVTAESLALELKTYEALELQDKVQEVGDMLSTLFPNHEYAQTLTSATESKPKEIKKQPVSVKERSRTLAKLETKETKPVEAGTTKAKVEVTVVDEAVKYHVIKKGETLYRVTRIYDVSLEQLRAWNPELKVNDISIGTKIYLQAQ
jgi:type IV pilus biogenesis/stability protein PilW